MAEQTRDVIDPDDRRQTAAMFGLTTAAKLARDAGWPLDTFVLAAAVAWDYIADGCDPSVPSKGLEG